VATMQSLLACLPLLESLLTWYVWFFIPMKGSSMLCRAFGLFVIQLLISKGASVLELLETEAFFLGQHNQQRFCPSLNGRTENAGKVSSTISLFVNAGW
jgi:hypothetical protein